MIIKTMITIMMTITIIIMATTTAFRANPSRLPQPCQTRTQENPHAYRTRRRRWREDRSQLRNRLVALGGAVKMSYDTIRASGISAFAVRSVITTSLVLCFFQVLPHQAVGVSEVHLILGSTLLLMFGAGPAAVGLALVS